MNFPLGVYSDGNLSSNGAAFRAMLYNCKAHYLDSIFLANGYSGNAGILAESDALPMSVYFNPGHDINDWLRNGEATIEAARAVIYPAVDRLKVHPSVKGYSDYDYPPNTQLPKLQLAQQAFGECDPFNPAWPVFGGDQDLDPPLAAALNPVVWCSSIYNISGYPAADATVIPLVVKYCWSNRPVGRPLWAILQTHGSGYLVQPTVEQVRYSAWQAIGNGVTGIFWFTYETQQGWVGLIDNAPLFNEVADLARRIGPLRARLMTVTLTPSVYTVDGGAQISTLTSPAATYIVVVNVANVNTLKIAGPRKQLTDMETNRRYQTGKPIQFRPGDGRIFRVQ